MAQLARNKRILSQNAFLPAYPANRENSRARARISPTTDYMQMLKRPMNISGELTATRLIQEAAERAMKISLSARRVLDTGCTPTFGSGQVRIHEVQPGLVCEQHHLNCHEDLEFICAVDPQITCAITLEGKLEGIDIEGHGMVDNPLNQGTLIAFGEPARWVRRVRAGQYFKTCSVTLQPAFFEHFSESFANQQLSELDAYRVGLHVKSLPMSQRLVALGHSAFELKYSGGLAALYQETNALQFILEVVQLLREENWLLQEIGRNHFNRLMHARSILDNSLLDPPKTLDLARQVGTNVTTLQAHFKLALGTTIFGYVKAQRLEMARVLLLEHRLAVSETAHRVGFSSPSAFAASYRRHFGHPPSAVAN